MLKCFPYFSISREHLSFPSLLPYLSLECCSSLPRSFGDRGSHLRRWLVAQPSSERSHSWRFPGVFLRCTVNTRRSVHDYRCHPIITLIISRQTWLMWYLGQMTNGLESEQELVVSPHQLKAYLVVAHGSMDHRSMRSWSRLVKETTMSNNIQE
jgi:hypothetical protein